MRLILQANNDATPPSVRSLGFSSISNTILLHFSMSSVLCWNLIFTCLFMRWNEARASGGTMTRISKKKKMQTCHQKDAQTHSVWVSLMSLSRVSWIRPTEFPFPFMCLMFQPPLRSVNTLGFSLTVSPSQHCSLRRRGRQKLGGNTRSHSHQRRRAEGTWEEAILRRGESIDRLTICWRGEGEEKGRKRSIRSLGECRK